MVLFTDGIKKMHKNNNDKSWLFNFLHCLEQEKETIVTSIVHILALEVKLFYLYFVILQSYNYCFFLFFVLKK